MSSMGITIPKSGGGEKEKEEEKKVVEDERSGQIYGLLVLKLSDMNFGHKSSFPLLKQLIQKSRLLNDLNLSNTMISSKELASITSVLKDGMSIKWLDISYNQLSFSNANEQDNEEFMANLCDIIYSPAHRQMWGHGSVGLQHLNLTGVNLNRQ